MNFYEHIDDYVNGNLPAEKQQLFEAELLKDSNLKEEVALHRDVLVGIEAFTKNELLEKLKQTEQEMAQNESGDGATKVRSLGTTDSKPGNRKFAWKYWAAAASVVLITAVSYLLFFASSSDSAKQVYAANFKPYLNVLEPINRDNANIRNQAMALYQKKEYEKAIELFNQKIMTEPENGDMLFYRGVSFMCVENWDNAIADFKKISSLNEKSRFDTQSRWFLALAYLGKNDVKSCKTVLKALEENGGEYIPKAQQLLEQL